MRVRFTTITEMLGTNPANDETFGDYVGGTTIFRRDAETGQLCICDYMIKDTLKARGDAIRARKGKDERGVWGAIKGKIDEDVHIYPRTILLGKTDADGMRERSLRAQTAQGPRVSLTKSEYISAGLVFECEIVLRPGRITEAMLIEMLDEMQYMGIGQWRNAGYGRLKYEIVT